MADVQEAVGPNEQDCEPRVKNLGGLFLALSLRVTLGKSLHLNLTLFPFPPMTALFKS